MPQPIKYPNRKQVVPTEQGSIIKYYIGIAVKILSTGDLPVPGLTSLREREHLSDWCIFESLCQQIECGTYFFNQIAFQWKQDRVAGKIQFSR